MWGISATLTIGVAIKQGLRMHPFGAWTLQIKGGGGLWRISSLYPCIPARDTDHVVVEPVPCSPDEPASLCRFPRCVVVWYAVRNGRARAPEPALGRKMFRSSVSADGDAKLYYMRKLIFISVATAQTIEGFAVAASKVKGSCL